MTEPDAASDMLLAVRELHAATEYLLDAIARQYGINRNDLRCLELLDRGGAMSAGALSQSSGLSPAAITKVVDRLEAAGYVTRHPDSHDRRGQLIAASDTDIARRHAIWRSLHDDTMEILREVSAPRARQATELLRRIAAAYRTHAGS